MQKWITCLMVCFALLSAAQNKKSPPPAKKTAPKETGPRNEPQAWESTDTLATDTSASEPKLAEPPLPRQFMVLTKKPKQKNERVRLCFNLVSKDTVLNYCVNDSICKDPEVYKILHESRSGDTTYLLIFVDAFTKVTNDDPRCNAGHETKLVFFRWNTKTNKVRFKQKVISSCLRNIVNMTKDPIANWDGSSVLEVSYYKGGNDFPLVKFDPGQPLLGLQEFSESEPR